jgi:hypothetical protein
MMTSVKFSKRSIVFGVFLVLGGCGRVANVLDQPSSHGEAGVDSGAPGANPSGSGSSNSGAEGSAVGPRSADGGRDFPGDGAGGSRMIGSGGASGSLVGPLAGGAPPAEGSGGATTAAGGTLGVGGVLTNGGLGGTQLNPQPGCAARPFVISINPDGHSGSVTGWHETSPAIAFDGEYPRFMPKADDGMAFWWSVGDTPGGASGAYFYAGTLAQAQGSTPVSVAVAAGAKTFADIDVASLTFGPKVVPAVAPGTILVFEAATTPHLLAVRFDALYVLDPDIEQCVAIDVSWTFAI